MTAIEKAYALGAQWVEIDVRQNKDGVFYDFHDSTVDRTTDGTGPFGSLSNEEIAQLDAGSWFRHEFAGEKIPTVKEIVEKMKGKIGFYFDFKSGDAKAFAQLVKQWGVEEQCFFNADPENNAVFFEEGMPLKVDANTLAELKEMKARWNMKYVQISPPYLNKALVHEAHKMGLKVIPYVSGDQVEMYAECLKYDIDMINLDNPDMFREIQKNGQLDIPRWVAHRGGVVNAQWSEYNPQGIKATFDRGYAGVEVDIWQTADGHLVVHHEKSLKAMFGVDKAIDKLTLAELKKLKALNGGYPVLTLEEHLALVPEDVMIMPDIKTPENERSQKFYDDMEKAISARHDFSHCIFIDDAAKSAFWGKARFGVRVADLMPVYAKFKKGENVACHYFLFEHGNKINAEAVRLAQYMHIEVIPTVNTFHYRMEDKYFGGKRDIENLRKLGVRTFQIDSLYDHTNLD
ncbi:glycerophosphodiester phosphodiesterase [Marinilongibacter aquaticus]|uniref:glycerophosphodiester phosphodiesterase n=1 Tax=Marinilongibacter aquaticus TaxID=2975157 RepID=UPI0021BD54A2|nr:glycerophosphodiester phosphodiesterase family protein [Marinilongibacter aquaticus]